MAIAGDFDDGTFDRDSPAHLGPLAATIAEVGAEAAADTLAEKTFTVDGASRRFILIEDSETNELNYSQGFNQSGDWPNAHLTVDDDTTASDDPLGGNTAERLNHSMVDFGGFYLSQGFGWKGAQDSIATSIYFKQDDSAYAYVGHAYSDPHDPDFNYITIDPSDGSIDSYDVENDYQAVEGVGDGWYYTWFTYQDAASGNTAIYVQVQDTAGDWDWFTSTSTDTGIFVWQVQYEHSFWPTSLIETTTASVTRDAADFYWAEGDVDSNLRGEIDIYVIPSFSSAMLNDADVEQTIIHFDDATDDYRLFFEAGASANGRLVLEENGTPIITTPDLAWSRGQALHITLDPNNGSNSVITRALFTSGNGSSTGTTYSTDSGDVWLGRNADAATDYFHGALGEPEYTAGGPPVQNISGFFSRPF